MDVRKSELAERLFENTKENSKLLSTTKSGGNIFGSKVKISGKDYLLSDGSISKIINEVAEIRRKFPEKR